ncbi:MAG: pilus assembly protein TadG-related protein [Gemmatimonadaceae bacterium]
MMVAIMLVAFMGVGAIAADIGRLNVVAGEIQTAADAAALRGAKKLQATLGTSVEVTVENEVISWVQSTNRADAAPLSVTAADVDMVLYTPPPTPRVAPATGTFASAPAGTRPNAVRVNVTASPTGIFSQIIGRVAGLTMTRQATAWIGNLPSNCVRPWGFPYIELYKQVYGTANPPIPLPDLDGAAFTQYMQLPNSSRMFVMLGANQNSGQLHDSAWRPLNFTGNAGRPGFTNGIQDCNSPKLNPDAADGVSLPAQNPNNYVNWSWEAVNGQGPGNNNGPPLCYFQSPSAACFVSPTATTPGVTINATWGVFDGNGSNLVDWRYVGEFELLCFFSSTTDVCPTTKAGGYATTNYPRGTIIGYMRPLKARIITPDDILGNAPSNLQVIRLVK